MLQNVLAEKVQLSSLCYFHVLLLHVIIRTYIIWLGYELNADNTTCSSPKAYIVFTKSGDLHKLSLQTHTDELIPVGKVKQALAIGLDHKEGFVYWSDAKMKSISRGRVRSGWDSEKVKQRLLLTVKN